MQDKLAALGLQRDTAFACLFDFLYRPVPEVLDMFTRELNVLLDPVVREGGVGEEALRCGQEARTMGMGREDHCWAQ